MLSSLPRRGIIARLLSAATKNSAWTFTATTRTRAQLTVRACKADRLNVSLARVMRHMPILARNPVVDACTGSISGLLSVNMYALVSPLYYSLAPQLLYPLHPSHARRP